MSILLQAEGLSKRYDSHYFAVNNLNLKLESGKIVGLLGPNGSGKTTFIKMINGLLKPSAGKITISGQEPNPFTKSLIAYLPEKTYFRNNMLVSEIIDYFTDFYADFKRDRAYTMLTQLGLKSDVKIKTLSKGMSEKLQLILVMSRDAKLYILDEPIAGVDPASRDYILRTILTNYNPEATILLSTHLIQDIENILDEVIFIQNGSITLHSTVENIRETQGKSVDAYFREVFTCFQN